eukprot:6214614-Pleurochrysis_carterae.AAC.9
MSFWATGRDGCARSLVQTPAAARALSNNGMKHRGRTSLRLAQRLGSRVRVCTGAHVSVCADAPECLITLYMSA